jgi:hypothetical protein
MTLQIGSADTISGIPIKDVRGYFRDVVGWHHQTFDLHWLQDHLSLDETPALASLVERLV